MSKVLVDREDFAHELWSAAQLVPGEGISDGVARIAALLAQTAPQPEQNGLVLMPKEATPEIVAAMKRELDKATTWYCRYSAAYRAALSAQGPKP